LLSNYFAATVSDLIADINAANAAGGTNTIALTAPTNSPYVLHGLVIANKDILSIIGNGDTIDANHVCCRIFSLDNGGSLTLENMTLQNGQAFGSGVDAQGGAIYNEGTLDLNAVIVQGCVAQGTPGSNGGSIFPGPHRFPGIPGGPAAGGAIWSGGSLTLENGTLIQNNQAIGGNGGPGGQFIAGSPGGSAFGGGVYISGGRADLIGVTINNNGAIPGQGCCGDTPFGDGGGLYVASGKVNLSGDTMDGNRAGIQWGLDAGGGMFLAAGSVTLCNDTVQNNSVFNSTGGFGIDIGQAKVYIDAFTLAHVDSLAGPYMLQNC
jgi:hypothetical protein